MLSWLLLMLLLYSKEICTAAARNCWGLEDFFLVNCTKYNVKSFSTQRENWDFL